MAITSLSNDGSTAWSVNPRTLILVSIQVRASIVFLCLRSEHVYISLIFLNVVCSGQAVNRQETDKKHRDYHQRSAVAIYPQQHCVGWALPNTKQTFQDMVWYLF
jgi:hypothetical protein